MEALDEDFLESLEGLKEDWAVIEKILPAGWEEKARELGALLREKGFAGPSPLLRTLLIHLNDGCALRETAVRAKEGGLADVSDVALLKRLRGCGEWFRWMVEELVRSMPVERKDLLPGKRIRLVDASVVSEPGATGSTWRLHYSINLSTLSCEEAHVTEVSVGESLTRFAVKPGDVLMGDRGLAHVRGVRHVVKHGGDVIVRKNLDMLPLTDGSGQPLALLPKLRALSYGETGSWQAQISDKTGALPVKVCAIKKSETETQRSQEKLRKTAKRKGHQLKPETLEAAGYIVVVTTLLTVAATTILALYRFRWQIELAFKRLKSLLQLGHLKKKDKVGARAWLQGKLLVAVLIEKLIAVGERFSPWGYLLRDGEETATTMLLARGVDDAFPRESSHQSGALADKSLARLAKDRRSTMRVA